MGTGVEGTVDNKVLVPGEVRRNDGIGSGVGLWVEEGERMRGVVNQVVRTVTFKVTRRFR